MHGKKHFQKTFALLLLTIILFSLAATTILYAQFSIQFHDKVSDNLRLTGESIAQSINSDIVAEAHSTYSDLMANANYKPLRTFRSAQTLLEQQKQNLLFRSIDYNLDVVSDSFLFYPDENTVLSYVSSLRSLTLDVNWRYKTFLQQVPHLTKTNPVQWFLVDGGIIPSVPERSIAFSGLLTFWSDYEQAPIVLFILSNAILKKQIDSYATNDIDLSICFQDTVFMSTYSREDALFTPVPVETGLTEWSDDEWQHVSFPLGNSGLYLVVSTSVAYYSESMFPLLQLFIVLSISILITGIIVSWFVANRMYSPLRQLTDAVAYLYSPATQSSKDADETVAVLSAFDAIRQELNNMGQLFEANMPYLRNAILHDLFHGSQFALSNDHELLKAARIHLPHDAYCVAAVRLFSPDLQKLSDIDRNVAPYTLMNNFERVVQTRASIYGQSDSERLLLLINAPEKLMPSIMNLLQETSSTFMSEQQIRLHVYSSAVFKHLSEVSLAAQELESQFFNNFLNTTSQTCTIFDIQTLITAILDAVKRHHGDDLEAALIDFVHAVSLRSPADGFSLLRQLGLMILPTLPDTSTFLPTDSTRMINLLFSPHLVLWNITEYPHALREMIDSVFPETGSGTAATNELQVKVREYVLSHLNEPISRDSLATELQFNPSYFSTLFKTQCSVSVSQYIFQVKMEHAVSLLLNSNCSIAEISEQLGFSSPQYFIRKFRDQYSLTPTEFRKHQIQ